MASNGSAIVLTATWTANATDAYSYAAGTGSGTAPAAGSGLDGTTIVLAANTFSEPGYTFSGWTDGSATYAAGATYTLASNGSAIVLTATWTANATDAVTFNSEGGSTVGSESGLQGTTITLPSAPSRAGYVFDGWFAGPSGGSALTSPYTLAGSVTLYAQWTANATDTVTFNSEGGSTVGSESGLQGTTITLPSAPSRAGYVFDGWFAGPSGGSALTSPYTLAGSVTLYAQWTPNATDTVTFNSEGGSTVGSESGLQGTTITLPSAPSRAGYVFDGWFAAPSGGSALTSPYTLAGSVTLYAQWAVAPTTAVLVPSTGAILSGTSATLDASASAGAGISKVQFVLSGGSYNKAVIGTATATIYGYSLQWNTTSVPGGTYTLQSLVTDNFGNTAYSTGITVTVDNTPPSTAVIIPATGADLSGTSATLDATASASYGVGITKVQFVLTGGSYNKTVLGTATPTLYGYLFSLNTTTVVNGTYTLQSLATDGAGNTAYSTGITVTVGNTPPSTAVIIPATGAVLSGTSATLDATASASNGVGITKVQFVLTGGSFNKFVLGTATPTLYGYLFSLNTTTIVDGTYTLQSLATDGSGNTTYSSPITITIGN